MGILGCNCLEWCTRTSSPVKKCHILKHRLWPMMSDIVMFNCDLHSPTPLFFFFFWPLPPQGTTSILSDDRFKVMFENPDYQVDEESEEYRLLNPLVSKVSQKRKKKLKMLAQLEAEEEVRCPIKRLNRPNLQAESHTIVRYCEIVSWVLQNCEQNTCNNSCRAFYIVWNTKIAFKITWKWKFEEKTTQHPYINQGAKFIEKVDVKICVVSPGWLSRLFLMGTQTLWIG